MKLLHPHVHCERVCKLRMRKIIYTLLTAMLFLGISLPAISTEAAAGEARVYTRSGSIKEYSTVEEALAQASSGDRVVLQKNAVISSDAVVKSGVLLLLPAGAKDTTGYYEGYNPKNTGTVSSPKRYVTLTVSSGATLSVSGTVLVNAVTGIRVSGYSNGYGVSGDYSEMNLQGKIEVASGGVLDVCGYLGGPGSIRAYAGGTVRDLFVVKHWRGGSYATAVVTQNNYIFPLNEYDMHNIQSTTRIDSGASLVGTVRIYVDGSYYDTRFPQIDNSNGLYRLGGGYALKMYSGGREILQLFGGGKFANSTLELLGHTQSTKDFFYPIDGDCSIELYSGTYTYNNMYKYMPGARVTVASSATLTIPAGKQVVFYDRTFKDAYMANGTAYPTSRGAAYLYVYGKVNVKGEKAALAGMIVTPDAKKVTITSGAKGTVTTKESGSEIGYIKQFTFNLNVMETSGTVEPDPSDPKPIDPTPSYPDPDKPGEGGSGNGGSGSGDSGGSDSMDTPIFTKPAVVQNLKSVMVYGKHIKLTWTRAYDASQYYVYRATSKNGKYKKVAATKSLSYTDKKAAFGRAYYYKVRAVKASGKSYVTSSDSKIVPGKIVPLSPRTLKKSTAKKRVTLKWSSVKRATGYQVYRSTKKNSGYKKVADIRGKSYTDKKVKSRKTYYYKVRVYTKVKGKKVYGDYSKIIRAKTK